MIFPCNMSNMDSICDLKTLDVPIAVKKSYQFFIKSVQKQLTLNVLHLMPVIDG